jgi:hypothetical protein
VLREERIIMQVQVLLEELAMVQEEITWLERKVEELKLRLHQEREENKEREIQQLRRLPENSHDLLCVPDNWSLLDDQRSRSQNYDDFRKERITRQRRLSLGSVSEILSMPSTRANGKLKIFTKKSVHKPPAYTKV